MNKVIDNKDEYQFFYDKEAEHRTYVFIINGDTSIEDYINLMIGYKSATYELRQLFTNNKALFKWGNENDAFSLVHKEVFN